MDKKILINLDSKPLSGPWIRMMLILRFFFLRGILSSEIARTIRETLCNKLPEKHTNIKISSRGLKFMLFKNYKSEFDFICTLYRKSFQYIRSHTANPFPVMITGISLCSNSHREFPVMNT